MCRLPWSRHHSALAFPGRSAEALPAPWLLLGGGGQGWDGRGIPHSASSSAFLFVLHRLDPRRCLVLGPGGGGGYQRTPGAPPAPPQPSFFLRLCSVQGAPPCGVSEPALHTDASCSIPWPGRGSWHGPPLRGGGILSLAVPAGQSCSPCSPHPGE